MRKSVIFLTLLSISPTFVNATTLSFDLQSASALQKLSYAFGYEVIQDNNTFELDTSAFIDGIKAAAAKEKIPFSKDELRAASEEVKAIYTEKNAEKTKLLRQQNIDFLTENKNKEGVHSTASGLQYTIQKSGDGKKPTPNDVVEVHYEGRLINGEVFDSSFDQNKTIEFQLDQVIDGWVEGLQLMQEGAEYTFFVPAELAYGEQQQGPIPANSTLIFKVQLIKVK